VRHPDWFGEPWRTRLTELLAELGVGRAVLDSRAVHAGPDDPQAESKRRKPQLPFHPDVTSDTAFVRFIAHPTLERNHRLLDEVAELAVQWLARGKQTYLFAHCPDERQSVHVARELHRRVRAEHDRHVRISVPRRPDVDDRDVGLVERLREAEPLDVDHVPEAAARVDGESLAAHDCNL